MRRFIQHDELQLSRHHVVPGLYERAKWHNGEPPRDNATGRMPWSNAGQIMAQSSEALQLATHAGATSRRLQSRGESVGDGRSSR